jgi:hypothetical protein
MSGREIGEKRRSRRMDLKNLVPNYQAPFVASTIVGLSFSEIFKAFLPKKEIKKSDLRDYSWGLEPRSHPPLFTVSTVNAKTITCIFCYYGEIGVWKVSR